MFDSSGGNIPAGAQNILLPTDGKWAANNTAVRAKFPHAAYQSYSAVGQVPGQWIDVEPGCVWPPQAAVDLYHRWVGNGITCGFYCSVDVRPQIQALLAAGDHPEWFEADPTQNPHIRAGDAETQWGWFGSYDETEIPAKPAPPAPGPTTEDLMRIFDTEGQPTMWWDGSKLVEIQTPAQLSYVRDQLGVDYKQLDAAAYTFVVASLS